MGVDAFVLFNERKFDELVNLIRRGGVSNFDEPGPRHCWTLLHYATEYSHHQLIRELVIHGADVNSVDEFGCAPLHMAFKPETAQLLIELGGDVNFKNRRGMTPLFIQWVNSDDGVVKILLNAGAKIDERMDDGNTPLMNFIRENVNSPSPFPVGAMELIAAGADVNAVNNDGDSVLHLAARHSIPSEVVKSLLEAGADPLYLNREGYTASELAQDDEGRALIQRAVLNAELLSLTESSTDRIKRGDGGI